MVFKKGNIPWMKGKKHTEVSKKKQSKAHKGKTLSEEHKKKIGEASKGNTNMLGKRHSEETKKKMSELSKGEKNPNYGKKFSAETLRRMSESQKGKQTGLGKLHSEETRNKISKANKGKKKKKKARRNMSESHRKEGYINEGQFKKGTQHWLGRKHTEATKRKLSEAHKGKKLSEEHKKKLSGENNHGWLGGISFEPYDKNFNRKFKKSIRGRDNNICMLCNASRNELKKALHVHHIDYDKKNSTKENGISLCGSCHSKTNFNRKYWIIFFHSLLKEKYGYKY